MITVRQRILAYLSEQHTATVEELSKVFKVTPANIRHHLSILTDQGSVCVIGMKPTPSRGRPAQIYAPSRQTDQNNLDQLADVLLSFLQQNSPQPDPDILFGQLANQLATRFPIDQANPTRRLYSSIKALNRMNYQAHWEAHIENPRIMLSHCPYSKVLDRHPEICRMDVYMLQALLGTPVKLAEWQTLGERGLPQCVFLLNRTV